MKPLLPVLVLVAFLQTVIAALPTSGGRMITDIRCIPNNVLQRSISPKFYQSLLVSPIQGWVVVRADLSSTRLVGMRVVHSELDGAYDSLALERANEAQIAGYYSVESRTNPPVLLHLLIYQIADGTMALSFAHIDEPGGNQMEYWGCARLAVLKSDGKWTDIKGPETLEGKGWAVRQGMKNKMEGFLMMEKIAPGK
jgi:hypothetical protein